MNKLVNSTKDDSEKIKARRKSSVNKMSQAHRNDVNDINFLTMESLILAQDERWRRASYMQVEREAYFGEWKVADG